LRFGIAGFGTRNTHDYTHSRSIQSNIKNPKAIPRMTFKNKTKGHCQSASAKVREVRFGVASHLEVVARWERRAGMGGGWARVYRWGGDPSPRRFKLEGGAQVGRDGASANFAHRSRDRNHKRRKKRPPSITYQFFGPFVVSRFRTFCGSPRSLAQFFGPFVVSRFRTFRGIFLYLICRDFRKIILRPSQKK
jgi:hypothetical protein